MGERAAQWLKLRRRWYSFGYACANFGAPISLRDYLEEHGWEPRGLEKTARGARVEELAGNLMAAVGQLIPVLPVSAVAHVFISNPEQAFTLEALQGEVQSLIGKLEKLGAQVYIPRENQEYATDVGLRMLTLRRLVAAEDGQYRAQPSELPVLRYYANAIECLTGKL